GAVGTEVRGQRSGVRGQRSEVRGQRSEVRGQRSERVTSTMFIRNDFHSRPALARRQNITRDSVNRFNGFAPTRKPLKRLGQRTRFLVTQMKLGVNEKLLRSKRDRKSTRL